MCWGIGKQCPPVVHYWADLQSVQGFRYYDSIAPNAKCQRVLVLSLSGLCLCYLVRWTKLFSMPSMIWYCWLGGRNGIWPAETEWWGTGMVICLERGANDLHMVQLMPPPFPQIDIIGAMMIVWVCVLSHWAHFTVLRFIFVYLLFCVWLHIACICSIVTWWGVDLVGLKHDP